ncbi:HAD family phosphatase [Lujinxingia vulgaris]|uniref:HAD family phosphatase n=1 Tax=Lujinxingia vulgaris TaxID=2600176 RepID=A0A5C6XB97_9DELT|nr:HAD family phosphatase [Lujinxingia vulgaris]TXD35350.1 HAD family phosphatase [Lujinxingia vulgaris]
MSDTPILLLDVMSTLVYDPIAHEIPAFFDLPLPRLFEVKHPTAWVDFEHGELTEDDFYDIFLPPPYGPVDGERLKAVLHDAYRWLDGIEELLAELREANIAMHTLSNYPVWYEVIESSLTLSRYLPWTFVSCNTGVRKPHPRAYLGAASTLGVDPARCIFVDDRLKNCEAARQVGMRAIVFESADQLRDELITHGVLQR